MELETARIISLTLLIVFILGMSVLVYFVVKTELHFKRKMREIETRHLYWKCLNRISEMNGGEYKFCPKTYYKKDKTIEEVACQYSR